MRRTFDRLIELALMWLLLFFVLSNIQYWSSEVGPMLEFTNETPKWWITLNIFRLWRSQLLSTIAIVGMGITGLVTLMNSVSINTGRRRLTKYDKTNYAKLLTKFERRRGTTMMKYSDASQGGVPIETGFLKSWYRIKTPLARKYNAVAKHFFLPSTKIWNEEKLDDEGNQIVMGGVPVMAMRKYWLAGPFDKVWYLTGDHHTLFVGSTGRGKTYTFVLLMIYSFIQAGESIVVHDPKREIDAMTRSALERAGYKVIVIDFVDPKNSDGWNPFEIAYVEWKRAIDEEIDTWTKESVYNDTTESDEIYYVKNVFFDEEIRGNSVIPAGYREVRIEEKDRYTEGYKYANVSTAVELVMDVSKTLTWEEDAKDPVWHEGAGDMFAGGAIFAMEEGVDEYVNATTARYLIEFGADADDSGVPLLKKYLQKHRGPLAESTVKYATYLNSESTMRSSFKSMFTSKVSLLTANEDIARMTSKSTFNMEDVFEEKTAIFIKTHDEKSTYYPLVTIFLKQLYEAGIKETRERPADQRLKIPMNWIIDEMGLLPEIKDIEALYGAARSRGIRINAFIQSFEQLEDKYEDKVAKIIEDNSTNVVYLGSQTRSTRERFSELAGEELVYDRRKKDYITRPVIRPERLQGFEKGRALINTIEWNPFISKLPPYNKYNFFEKVDWSYPHTEKPRVQFFNIRTEWRKRAIAEGTNRKWSAEKKGSKEFDILGGKGLDKGMDKAKGLFALKK